MKRKVYIGAQGLGGIGATLVIGYSFEKEVVGGWKVIFWLGAICFMVVLFLVIVSSFFELLDAAYRRRLKAIAARTVRAERLHTVRLLMAAQRHQRQSNDSGSAKTDDEDEDHDDDDYGEGDALLINP